jgi:hypothetical protein
MPNRVVEAWNALLGRRPTAATAVTGELSALRAQGWRGGQGPFFPKSGLTLDTTRVNYALARDLFDNRLPDYKLGAGFARPIVNAKAGFIGRPTWDHPDADVETALARMSERWAALLYLLVRNGLRDGDAFARLDVSVDPLRNPDQERVVLRLPPPEWVDPDPDPITGQLLAVTINHPVYAPNRDLALPRNSITRSSQQASYTLVERITQDRRTVHIDEGTGRPSDEVRARYGDLDEPNPWGFVPVVHFRNEPDDHALFGVSELESVEPILQAYHEVMLHAVQGTRLFSWPKIKFVVRDPDQFLDDNSPGWRTGTAVNWQDKEILILRAGSRDAPSDDAAFLQANAGTADVSALLELLYACIVETSEVPEFVFGAAISSSKASVSEQLLPFEKTIERKRLMLASPFTDLGTMYALMGRRTGELINENGLRLTERAVTGGDRDVEVDWPEMAPRDEQALARTIAEVVKAFVDGVQSGLLSAEAASEFLRGFVPTMEKWTDDGAESDEQRRIIAGLRFIEQAQGGGPPPAAAGGGGRSGGTPPGTVPTPNLPLVDYAALLTRINGGGGGGGSNGTAA